ncbi:MAG: metallophosphoesterase [Myxococcota bacterium]
MGLFALSDLHVDHPANWEALEALPARPQDDLILAGDIAEHLPTFERAIDEAATKFRTVYWVPGNHELWTVPKREPALRGAERYKRLVEICRARGVRTPEDPYDRVGAASLRICPLFVLYDYSFSPDGMNPEEARAWAKEQGIVCTDEHLLHPDPYPSREAWCRARIEATERRLDELGAAEKTILINHFPLHRQTLTIPLVPRFSPWCGTRKTEDWHLRFRAHVVVTGHLHVPMTHWVDGIRFEEVSVGYPRDWDPSKGLASRLRQILPEP